MARNQGLTTPSAPAREADGLPCAAIILGTEMVAATSPHPTVSLVRSTARRLGLRAAPRGQRSWLDGLCVAWLAWLLDRINDLAPVRQRLAERHAVDVLALERSVHLAPEHALNAGAASHAWAGQILVAWYEDAHIYITFGVLAWVWWRRPALLAALRTTFFAVNAVALLAFWTYRVAPPRMLPAGGFRDLNAIVDGYPPWHGGAVALHSNQLAALPSLHVAWAVTVSVALVWATRRAAVRVVAVLYPFITTLAVMATANHFLADAVTGAAVAVLVAVCARRLIVRRRTGRPPRADQHRAYPLGMLLVRRRAAPTALSLVLLLTVAGLLAAPAIAAACPRASLPDVESQVMCVSCGVPLNLANSPQADGERRLIRALIAQCQDAPQIKAAMKAEYGPNVLALPSGGGFSRVVWIVPGAAALIGIAAVALIGARWRRRPRAPSPAGGWSPSPPLDAADRGPSAASPPITRVGATSDAENRRLDDDLSRFDP